MSATPAASAAPTPLVLKPLRFEGTAYVVEFLEVTRQDTTRMPVLYHDDRDEYPCFRWNGVMNIVHLDSQGKLSVPFQTDRFYVAMVEGLTFEEIIFLGISAQGYLFRTQSEPKKFRHIIDRMADKALAHHALRIGCQTLSVSAPFELVPFRLDSKDRILEESGSMERLEVLKGGHGNPIQG